MDFAENPDALLLKQNAVRFANEFLSVGVVARDAAEVFSRELWGKCAEFGVLGLPFPREYGGGGLDIVSTMLVMEGLGFGGRDSGLLFSLNAQMWAVQHPLLVFGTEAQKQRFLLPLIQGQMIGAHGMTEPGSGSDAFGMQTKAERTDLGYVLKGSKTFVTNAPVADLFLIFAMTNPSRGAFGVSAFLLERGTKGFVIGEPMSKMGLRTSGIAEVFLEDCLVPEESRLGREGQGAMIFQSSMEWERACILGVTVGAMERQLEACVQYARERRQFGDPIGKFQAVSHRIADMKVRLETARLLLYKVAWLKSQNKPAHLEAAMAKLYLSEAYVASSLDAIRIHGGYGYMTDFEVERDLRDATGGVLYSGTSDIQRNIIAKLLGV